MSSICDKTELKSHYDDLSGRYDGIPMLSDARTNKLRVDKFIEFLGLDPESEKIVDIGAGSGSIAKLIKEKYQKSL